MAAAFQAKPTHAFKHRVKDSTGRTAICSTGTSDRATAQNVVALVARLTKQRRWDVLDAIVAKRVKLKEVYDADERGELAPFMARLAEIDLSPLVAEWAASGANPRYVAQVRRLIKEGERFPVTEFRRRVISKHLANLKDARAHTTRRSASGSTKNRHRAAFSVFAEWLVERELIDTNPVRSVKGHGENAARMIWYERADAERLVAALPLPYRALEGLMAGTGMEWQAVERLKRSDVDAATRKIHARGGKTKYRDRTVIVTEDWTWAVIESYVRDFTPHASLFADIDHKEALKIHREAVSVLDLEDSTLHDWRHTYAVNWLKDRKPPAVLKRQLGHAPNSTVVERVYAVWIVTDSDYAATPAATIPATTLKVNS